MESAIAIKNLGKLFHRYHTDRPTTFIEAITRRLRHLSPEERFWAVRNISFEIRPGKMVGIIGANGAGKSTLLRTIGGVYRPDEGSVIVRGRIGALLDLGTGFHPELTGRENILINGVISGLTRKEVLAQYDSIIDFAELKDFIDSPLRAYSTGMQLRLAFAVATQIKPDILLIDEVLAVGDYSFQQKCLERIHQFKSRGCTILLVSHDLDAIRRLCDEAIWLRSGEMAGQAPAEIITEQYLEEARTEGLHRTPRDRPVRILAPGVELRPGQNRIGSFDIEITGVRLSNATNTDIKLIDCGSPLRVEIEYASSKPMASPVFLVSITQEDGSICFETSTEKYDMAPQQVQGNGMISLQIERLDLANGHYFVEVGVFPKDWSFAYDYHWHVYSFEIRGASATKGIISPPHRWI